MRCRTLRTAIRNTFGRVPGGPEALQKAIATVLDVDPWNVHVLVEPATGDRESSGDVRRRIRVHIAVYEGGGG
jgi:hypothetical protein